jgi:opacity protein-like surface antigen
LTPYIGAGIGVTSLRFGNYAGTYAISPAYAGVNPCGVGVLTCASPSVFPAKARTNLAWALMAGTAIELGGGLSIDLGYRYLHLGKTETGIDPNVAAFTGSAQKLKLKTVDAHEIKVGLRWELGAPLAREKEATVLGRKY